jgi:hypothetical protein
MDNKDRKRRREEKKTSWDIGKIHPILFLDIETTLLLDISRRKKEKEPFTCC